MLGLNLPVLALEGPFHLLAGLFAVAYQLGHAGLAALGVTGVAFFLAGLPFVMAFGDSVMLEEGTWLAGSQDAFRALGHASLIVRPAPVKAGIVVRRDGQWVAARDPRLSGQLDLP